MRRGLPLALLTMAALLLVMLAAVLISAAAVTLSGEVLPSRAGKLLVDVGWSGAPYPVQAVPIECLGNGILVYPEPGAAPRFYPLAGLQQEAAIVREVVAQGFNRLGVLLSRAGQESFLGAVLERDVRLHESFVLAMRQVDAANRLRHDQGAAVRQPILLVRPSGVACFQPVIYLLDTATRLRVGAEPMLQAWLFLGSPAR